MQTRRDLNTSVPPELRPFLVGFFERRLLEVDTLARHAEQKNYVAIAAIAHKIRGNGAGFGFPALSSVGIDLEVAAKDRDEVNVRKFIEELRGLIVHFQRHQ